MPEARLAGSKPASSRPGRIPAGKPETDQTRVGLFFTDRKPGRRFVDVPLGATSIEIPA